MCYCSQKYFLIFFRADSQFIVERDRSSEATRAFFVATQGKVRTSRHLIEFTSLSAISYPKEAQKSVL